MSRGRRRRLLPTACKTSPGGQPARPYKEEDHDCRYPRQAHVTSTDGTKIGVTVSGQGRPLAVSPGDHSAHTIQQEADDIAAVLDLAGPDAIPLGHSYGGLVTLTHALHQPPATFILYEPPIPLDGPVGCEAIAPFEKAVQAGNL